MNLFLWIDQFSHSGMKLLQKFSVVEFAPNPHLKRKKKMKMTSVIMKFGQDEQKNRRVHITIMKILLEYLIYVKQLYSIYDVPGTISKCFTQNSSFNLH